MEGPKDEYYSSLNTFDHDSALGVHPQLEVLPGPAGSIRKNEATVGGGANVLDASGAGRGRPNG